MLHLPVNSQASVKLAKRTNLMLDQVVHNVLLGPSFALFALGKAVSLD